MLIDHDDPPGLFNAGHCWACARQAGLLDHYDRVQDQETNLRQAREWVGAAHRYAIWAVGSSTIGILLGRGCPPYAISRPPGGEDQPTSRRTTRSVCQSRGHPWSARFEGLVSYQTGTATSIVAVRPPMGSCDPPGVDIGPGCPPGGRQATVSQRPTTAAAPLRTVEPCSALST
jgi:hypothetical protein